MSMNESDENEFDLEFEAYEIEDEDGDWGLFETELPEEEWQASEISITELLSKMSSGTEAIAPAELTALSDLSRKNAEAVESAWETIPVRIRQAVIEALVQMADADYRLQLGRILRIAMHDSEPHIRRLAIEGLWEDVQSDLVGSFTHILRTDDSTEVRAAAAGALGSFVLAGELEEMESSLAMRAEEALLSVLRNEEEPIEVQAHALESIAYSGEVGIRQLIEDAYYSPFEEMRLAALNAMGRSADVRWRGLARAELENPMPSMRAYAAIACGELEARAAVQEIIQLLDDEEESVRLAAIFALGRLGGKVARETLRAVADSEYEVEAEEAEDALAEMMFYGSADETLLSEEAPEFGEEWEDDFDDIEPWDGWMGHDDAEMGSYG